MQKFSERFRETIGQGFGHNSVIVVMIGFEFLDDFF